MARVPSQLCSCGTVSLDEGIPDRRGEYEARLGTGRDVLVFCV